MQNKIIIFSKNRAMLCDALLRSLIHKDDVVVIYKSTNNEFEEGYKKLIHSHMFDVQFIKEHHFKNDLLNALTSKQVSFMVDDDIVYNDFPFPELNPFETFSLRLHSSISNNIHYKYTMSLDGNIFRTEDVKPLIESIEFNNPNELEAKLQGNFGDKFNMIYNTGYLIGFNHTRVSESSSCFFTGEYTDKYLNQRYLNGEYIDFQAMNLKPTNNVHTSQAYKFIKP